MQITFDSDKDAINIAKHSVSLSAAELLDWSTVVVELDDRHDYGEERWQGYGKIGTRLHCVVFMHRDNVMRVISLRKANNREIRDYEERKT